MAYLCEICGKGIVAGHSQQHRRGVAGKRWKKRTEATHRTFKPNLQIATINEVKMRLCTKCIKRFKKDQLIATS